MSAPYAISLGNGTTVSIEKQPDGSFKFWLGALEARDQNTVFAAPSLDTLAETLDALGAPATVTQLAGLGEEMAVDSLAQSIPQARPRRQAVAMPAIPDVPIVTPPAAGDLAHRPEHESALGALRDAAARAVQGSTAPLDVTAYESLARLSPFLFQPVSGGAVSLDPAAMPTELRERLASRLPAVSPDVLLVARRFAINPYVLQSLMAEETIPPENFGTGFLVRALSDYYDRIQEPVVQEHMVALGVRDRLRRDVQQQYLPAVVSVYSARMPYGHIPSANFMAWVSPTARNAASMTAAMKALEASEIAPMTQESSQQQWPESSPEQGVDRLHRPGTEPRARVRQATDLPTDAEIAETLARKQEIVTRAARPMKR